jgi:coenzyme F420-reducing hydrogenase delta subunit
MKDNKLKIICFACKFGWGYLEGDALRRIEGLVPVICSGKVDTTHIIEAFAHGADGVLVLGCPEGECHFQIGNYQARKRLLLLRKTLRSLGIEPQRIQYRLENDPEGSRIQMIMDEMAAAIKELGPLKKRDVGNPENHNARIPHAG